MKNPIKKSRKPVLVGLSLTIILHIILVYFVYQEKGRKNFHELMISKDGACLLDIRLDEIGIEGNQTFITSTIFLRIKDVEAIDKVILAIEYPEHRRGLYRFEGTYHSGQRIFVAEHAKVPLYPEKGSLSDFPFDDLDFNIVLEVDPKKSFEGIELYQYVKGFSLSDKPEHELQNGSIRIKFHLTRAFYTKAISIVLGCLVIAYVVIVISFLRETTLLLTSLLIFFVSIWSLRNVAVPFIKGIPTNVDYFLLFLSTFLLCLILIKIVFELRGNKVDVGDVSASSLSVDALSQLLIKQVELECEGEKA